MQNIACRAFMSSWRFRPYSHLDYLFLSSPELFYWQFIVAACHWALHRPSPMIYQIMHLAKVGVETNTTIHPSIIRSLDATRLRQSWFETITTKLCFSGCFLKYWFRCEARTHFNDHMFNMDFVPTKWYKIFPFWLLLILLRIVYIHYIIYWTIYCAGNMEHIYGHCALVDRVRKNISFPFLIYLSEK